VNGVVVGLDHIIILVNNGTQIFGSFFVLQWCFVRTRGLAKLINFLDERLERNDRNFFI
jgi:hypothetical protein